MITINPYLAKKLKKTSLLKRIKRKIRWYTFSQYSYQVGFLEEKFHFLIDNFEGEISWGKKFLDKKCLTIELNWMKKNMIFPGDVIADVGAHQGFYGLLFSQWVSSEGQVHSFECAKKHYETLKRNFEINHTSNGFPHYCAVGESEGEIYVPSQTSTGILLSSEHEKQSKVSLVSLDYFFQSKRTPTVLKVDVEGYELEVLKGCRKILKTKPRINLELHNFAHENPRPRLEQIFELISDYKKTYIQFIPGGKISPLPLEPAVLEVLLEYPNPHLYLFPEESTITH